MKIINLKFTTC